MEKKLLLINSMETPGNCEHIKKWRNDIQRWEATQSDSVRLTKLRGLGRKCRATRQIDGQTDRQVEVDWVGEGKGSWVASAANFNYF